MAIKYVQCRSSFWLKHHCILYRLLVTGSVDHGVFHAASLWNHNFSIQECKTLAFGTPVAAAPPTAMPIQIMQYILIVQAWQP